MRPVRHCPLSPTWGQKGAPLYHKRLSHHASFFEEAWLAHCRVFHSLSIHHSAFNKYSHLSRSVEMGEETDAKSASRMGTYWSFMYS